MNYKMTINMYVSIVVSKNQMKEHAEQKQTHRYREHFDGCQMEGY